MKVKLIQKPRASDTRGPYRHEHWAKCEPFAVNRMGLLVHRIKAGQTIVRNDGSHIAVEYWCGGSSVGDHGKFEFVGAVPSGRVLCEKCEAFALLANQKSAEKLSKKRHVCKGKLHVIRSCNCGMDN